MTYTLRVLPEVEEDVLEATLYYEKRSEELGADFLQASDRAISEIEQAPLTCPLVHGRFRRKLLRRFPYALYFRIVENVVIVTGLFHCAREPRKLARIIELRDA